MADDDHGLAPLLGGGANGLGGRAWSQPLVGLRVEARGTCQLLRGLAGAEERAGDHRVGSHAVVGEPLAESAGGLATLGGQRPQFVRLALGSLRVTYEVELHRREPTRGRRGAACRCTRPTGG